MLEVNQYIEEKYLPEGALLLSTFPDLDLDARAGTKYYYEKLQENANSSNPSPALEKMLGGKYVLDPNLNGEGEDTSENSMHGSWKQIEGMSDAEKELIKRQMEYSLKDISSRSRGTIPGEMSGILDKINTVEPPIFNWKAYFRRLMGNSFKIYTKKSLRKFSKRFEGSAGLKIRKKQSILVAVDTSGSVNDSNLREFFKEIYHIWKSGVSVDIIQFDSIIQDISPYKGKFDGKVFGRGGTDFDAPITHYNENLNKYTTLILFTDGYAPIDVKPRKKMVWVLTSDGESSKKYPGYLIKIPKTK